MTRKNMDSTKLTYRAFAAASWYEAQGTAARPIVLRERRVFRHCGLSALVMGSASVAALALAHSAHAQDASATPVPDISVSAPPPPESPNGAAAAGPFMDGSAAAGYRVKDTTAAGPIWGDLPLQDAPYSISVVPAPLIENLQAWQPEDLVKVIPQINDVLPNQNKGGNTFFYIRGFSPSYSPTRRALAIFFAT